MVLCSSIWPQEIIEEFSLAGIGCQGSWLSEELVVGGSWLSGVLFWSYSGVITNPPWIAATRVLVKQYECSFISNQVVVER